MIEQDTSLLVKERNLDALGRLFAFPAENRVQHLPHGTVQLQPRQPTAPRSDPATTPHSTIRMPCSWVWDFTAKVLLRQHDLRIRTPRVPRRRIQGRSDLRLHLGRVLRMPSTRSNLRGRGFCPIGYIMGGATLGSYIDPDNKMWHRSAVDVDLRWFSNLFLFRRSRIRQFLTLNYTQGWNRWEGSDESIRFTSPPRTASRPSRSMQSAPTA